MKKPTERETAILYAFAAGFVPDWETAYRLSRQTAEDTQTRSIKSNVTHWKQHPIIVTAYENALAIIKAQEERRTEEIRKELMKEGQPETAGESESTKGRKAAAVDYSDPKQRKKLYNLIIQEASDDPKTQLDAAKLIEQTQRDDRQAARDNKIQRFFVPVSCKICPFYEKRRVKNPKKL